MRLISFLGDTIFPLIKWLFYQLNLFLSLLVAIYIVIITVSNKSCT